MFVFKGSNCISMQQRQTNIVPAVDHALATRRCDVERKGKTAVRGTHQLGVQIDDQVKARKRRTIMEQAINLRFGQRITSKPLLSELL